MALLGDLHENAMTTKSSFSTPPFEEDTIKNVPLTVATEEAHAVPTTMRATSRVALKIHENFFTVEYMEERAIPPNVKDVEAERLALFDDVNRIVDAQADEIMKLYSK